MSRSAIVNSQQAYKKNVIWIVSFKYFVAPIGYRYYNFLYGGLILVLYRFLTKALEPITGGIIKSVQYAGTVTMSITIHCVKIHVILSCN